MKDNETIKQFKQRVKDKTNKKGNKQMKTKFTTVAKYLATVIVTLAVVAGLYAFYTWSFNQGVEAQKGITKTVNAEVASQLKQGQK